MDRIRIEFLDDHPLILDGLAHTLAAEGDYIHRRWLRRDSSRGGTQRNG